MFVGCDYGGGSVDKFTRLDQLLSIPKILPGSARLADISGKITKIEKDPSVGGHNIHIKPSLLGDEKVHFVKADRHVTVKVGDTVEKGDTLTTGPINPRELLPKKGILAVRDYLTHSLKNEIYKDDTDVRRKNIETVVRNLTNMTRVVDPGDSHHLVGDLVHITHVDNYNKNISSKQAPIKHAPIIEGITQAAVHKDEDYLSRLNFQYIKETILQAASQGWHTKLKGNNPIGPVASGSIGYDPKGGPSY
jgi:DNA-directed RNA polymerase subunit beta'